MAEYVTKEQVIDWYRPYGQTDEPIPFETLVSDLRDMKTADVATVLHGRWLQKKHKIFGNAYDYVCSECGCDYALAEYNYCPNCGAKMEKMDLEEEQHELRRDL